MNGRVAVLARVECRSEGAGEQIPAAVWIASSRIGVGEILDDAVIGSTEAGGGNLRRVTVRLTDGQVLVLERDLPNGDWRVYRT